MEEENKEEMADKAAGYAGQAAEKASQFAGQAKEMLSKVDTGKAMGATSRFMAGVFKFGKVVSALFMLLCIATMALSILYALFKGEESMKTPEFKEVVAVLEDNGGRNTSASETANNQEYRKVRDRYRKQIDAIVDLYRLDARDETEELVKPLQRLPEKLRSPFVNGLISFGKDAKKYYAKKDDGRQFDEEKVLNWYVSMFGDAVEEAEASEEEARASRQVAWTVCGMAFLGLILFMFLPLLIQIEENTRK